MKVIPSFVKPATDNRLIHIMTALGNANPLDVRQAGFFPYMHLFDSKKGILKPKIGLVFKLMP
jgi:hypothetical protein